MKTPTLLAGLLALFVSVTSVAEDPEGAAMTVLLADDADHYLIKTAFGLVGWLTIPADSQVATVIEGLFFAGD